MIVSFVRSIILRYLPTLNISRQKVANHHHYHHRLSPAPKHSDQTFLSSLYALLSRYSRPRRSFSRSTSTPNSIPIMRVHVVPQPSLALVPHDEINEENAPRPASSPKISHHTQKLPYRHVQRQHLIIADGSRSRPGGRAGKHTCDVTFAPLQPVTPLHKLATPLVPALAVVKGPVLSHTMQVKKRGLTRASYRIRSFRHISFKKRNTAICIPGNRCFPNDSILLSIIVVDFSRNSTTLPQSRQRVQGTPSSPNYHGPISIDHLAHIRLPGACGLQR